MAEMSFAEGVGHGMCNPSKRERLLSRGGVRGDIVSFKAVL